jgi:hypothetical protein
MRSTLCLLIVCVGTIGAIFDGGSAFSWIALLGLTCFLILEIFRLSRMAQMLLAVCLALPAYALITKQFNTALFETALDRAAFMAFFLTSLSFLQHAAGRSELILRSGEILVNQRPGRRYLVITFGAALFGILLNLGTVGLLGTMISKGTSSGKTAEDTRIATVRKQRMTLAMMRGFCVLPMWSPITVTIAIVLASIPGVNWAQMVVQSGPLAVAFLLMGWGLDRMSYTRRVLPNQPPAPSLLGLLPLASLAIAVPLTAFIGSKILHTNLITALLILLPAIATSWIAIQEHDSNRPSDGLRRTFKVVRHDLLPAIPNMRTEIALFSCSAFIGVIVAGTVDTQMLGHTIIALGLSAGTLMVLSAWLAVGLSIVGISPIISVTILAGTLPNLSPINIDPVMVGVMLLTVWAISVGISPFSAAVRLSGRMVGEEPAKVGMSWNLIYSAISLIFLSTFLLIVQ